MKVFVTGGNGFIGSRVVRFLAHEGHSIRCLLRRTSDTRRIDDIAYEKHRGDLEDATSLQSGMKGCDAVIHLASVSSWAEIRSNSLEEVVVRGSGNVFQAALQAGGMRCVYVSSAAAINGSSRPVIFDEYAPFELEGTPLRYAIAKHQAEALAGEYAARGLPIVTVNPVEVYGPQDTDMVTACNILDILNTRPALAFSGGASIAHVDDVAAGIVGALARGKPGERYILGGENLTVEQIVRTTLQAAGLRRRVVKLPAGPLRVVLHALAAVKIPTPVAPEVMDYATRYFFMDSSKAKRELGYNPRPAQEVLRSVVQWILGTEWYKSKI